MSIATLKKRAEFERIRGGGRWSAALLVLEGKPRAAALLNPTSVPGCTMPRFGFTITRKVGNAVVRNRIRRRLRAALQEMSSQADPRFDYVVVARRAVYDCPFDEIKACLETAFRRVHDGSARKPSAHNAQAGALKPSGRSKKARPQESSNSN